MVKFWTKVSAKVDKSEKMLVNIGLVSLIYIGSVATYYLFVNNNKNEILVLTTALSVIVLFTISGFGLLKYTYFGKCPKIEEATEFQKAYASVFFTLWHIGLMCGFLLISYRLINLL
jgi:hypothetical protein